MEVAVEWLLSSDEPGIRLLAKRDLLGEANPEEESLVLDGPSVRALLDGQRADGGFGVHPYGKWQGAHWRLVSLVELSVPVRAALREPPDENHACVLATRLRPPTAERHAVVAVSSDPDSGVRRGKLTTASSGVASEAFSAASARTSYPAARVMRCEPRGCR